MEHDDISNVISLIRKDKINEAFITFMGQKSRVACDRKCFKAWGINNRPEHENENSVDLLTEVIYLRDHELGNAPNDARTTEGDNTKPLSPDSFPNKWCISPLCQTSCRLY
ncbi:hypothetical protein MNBD_GAMMA12-616 [hydrothermal vent metagenome]|uniref:Uncharacterized protein n=1 Tax=hydrothermal vent metagenome TaxID=652676 RepID=A0A3B0YVZ2_9ZZZZ